MVDVLHYHLQVKERNRGQAFDSSILNNQRSEFDSPGVLFHSRLPLFGIAPRMENSYDLNLISNDFVEHRERKAPHNRASERSVNNWIQVRIANDSRQCIVDSFYELDVQIFALVSVPLAGLGEFGIGFGSEPNDHLRLARFHEFSFDLVPGSTLSRIGSDRLQTSIELALLSLG